MAHIKLKKYSKSVAYKTGDGRSRTASATWIPYGHAALDKLTAFQAQESLADAVLHYDYAGLLLTKGVDDSDWRWVYMPSLQVLENGGISEDLDPPFITYLRAVNIFAQNFPTRDEAKSSLELALELWDQRP